MSDSISDGYKYASAGQIPAGRVPEVVTAHNEVKRESLLHPEQIKRGVATLRRWVDFFDPKAYENLLNQLAPDLQYAQPCACDETGPCKMHGQPAPPQIAGDTIKKMCQAYNDRGCCPESEAMQAAARVLADALCGPLSAEDKRQLGSDFSDHRRADPDATTWGNCLYSFAKLLERRRARIAPKTPEERVTVVEWIHDRTKWVILIDGWNMRDSAIFDKEDKHKAHIYAEGLRARLAKEQG